MEKEFTPEMKARLKEWVSAAKSVDEIIALAKESGIELTPEKAEELLRNYDKFRELSDDDLDNVSGGDGYRKILSNVIN